MKKIQSKHLNRKNFKRSLLVLLVLFVLGQLYFDYAAYYGILQSDIGPTNLIHLISSSTEALTKLAPTDPKTGDVYLTGSNLYLPPYTNDGGILGDSIRYNYAPKYDLNNGPETTITTSQILKLSENKLTEAASIAETSTLLPFQWNYSNGNKALNAVFSYVPNLQACSSLIHLNYSSTFDKTRSLIAEGSKKLVNGKTIYFYRESGCNKLDQYPSISKLVDYVKLVQSY